MKAIFRMCFDGGRHGTLHGIFIADQKQIADLVENKTNLYFGEVLGKHSEIEGPLEKSEIELITEDPEAIEIFEDYKLETGFNPLEYIQEVDEEEPF